MIKQLESLMQKEMTRREFLAALGLGVATLMGFGTIVRLLTGKHGSIGATSGYGSSTYGR